MVFMISDPPPALDDPPEARRWSPAWDVLVGVAIWAAVGLLLWWNW